MENNPVVDLFQKMCEKIVYGVSDTLHDQYMAKTHLQVVRISELIKGIADDASQVPEECLPTSFKRLKELSEQFLDMSPGTLSSIKSNRFR